MIGEQMETSDWLRGATGGFFTSKAKNWCDVAVGLTEFILLSFAYSRLTVRYWFSFR